MLTGFIVYGCISLAERLTFFKNIITRLIKQQLLYYVNPIIGKIVKSMFNKALLFAGKSACCLPERVRRVLTLCAQKDTP